jgi:hypothetical protein
VPGTEKASEMSDYQQLSPDEQDPEGIYKFIIVYKELKIEIYS